MDLPRQLRDNISKLHYSEPLPIQRATFSLIEEGKVGSFKHDFVFAFSVSDVLVCRFSCCRIFKNWFRKNRGFFDSNY